MVYRALIFAFFLAGCGGGDSSSIIRPDSAATEHGGSVEDDLPGTIILSTGQTTSYYPGDDAYYAKGSPRSYIRDDIHGYVVDHTLDLTWQDSYEDNGGEIKLALHTDAIDYCNALDLGGYDDWRLPYFNEVVNLCEFQNPIMLLDSAFVYDSTIYWFNGMFNDTRLYEGDFALPMLHQSELSFHGDAEFAVRCVRGPRYQGTFERTDATQTVIDLATSLQWQDTPDVDVRDLNFTAAIDYCEDLTLAGHSDWRLPNLNELYSLVDITKYGPVVPDAFAHEGLEDMTWSSTSVDEDSAAAVHFYSGMMLPPLKSDERRVRCVRNE